MRTLDTQGTELSQSSALPDRQRPATVSHTGRLEGQQCSWSSQHVASFKQQMLSVALLAYKQRLNGSAE